MKSLAFLLILLSTISHSEMTEDQVFRVLEPITALQNDKEITLEKDALIFIQNVKLNGEEIFEVEATFYDESNPYLNSWDTKNNFKFKLPKKQYLQFVELNKTPCALCCDMVNPYLLHPVKEQYGCNCREDLECCRSCRDASACPYCKHILPGTPVFVEKLNTCEYKGLIQEDTVVELHGLKGDLDKRRGTVIGVKNTINNRFYKIMFEDNQNAPEEFQAKDLKYVKDNNFENFPTGAYKIIKTVRVQGAKEPETYIKPEEIVQIEHVKKVNSPQRILGKLLDKEEWISLAKSETDDDPWAKHTKEVPKEIPSQFKDYVELPGFVRYAETGGYAVSVTTPKNAEGKTKKFPNLKRQVYTLTKKDNNEYIWFCATTQVQVLTDGLWHNRLVPRDEATQEEFEQQRRLMQITEEERSDDQNILNPPEQQHNQNLHSSDLEELLVARAIQLSMEPNSHQAQNSNDDVPPFNNVLHTPNINEDNNPYEGLSEDEIEQLELAIEMSKESKNQF